MKVILQRVSSSSVSVDGKVIGQISRGVMLLVGFGEGDDASKIKPMAEKIANLRIFPDERGRFHFSLLEISGEVLCVPQFTLFADTSKGRRPEFFGALKPELAEPLFLEFVKAVRGTGIAKVEMGKFGAHMMVSLENDGPVTITLES